ncbi:MAG: hypothetical protein KME35_14700 [Aphanocapsa sp. GSE-SYN-MK-11-07L]|nr:hypothetical protein [Aphanocapsa sp. GSE-SYN-MK-11-07L]
MLSLTSHAKVIGLTAVAAGLGGALSSSPAIAFTSATGVTFGPLTDGADSSVNSITYSSQSLTITGVTAGSDWTTVGGVSTSLTLQRSSTGNENQTVWSERAGSATTLKTSDPSTTEAALAQTNIYLGTDNLFANTSAGNPGTPNFSNVERVDFVNTGGITSAADLGVSIFERGVANGHDAFNIAAITGIDGSGNPTSFGSLLSLVNGSWGTTGLSPTASSGYTVLNDGGTGDFANTNQQISGQNVGGVVIPLTDLVSAGTTIFGYALFASDTTVAGACSAIDLLDINNAACYPTTTPQASGGIDLMAGNLGVLREEVPVPVPPQFVGMILSAVLVAAGKVRSKRKQRAAESTSQ